jgi:hypothetical protein
MIGVVADATELPVAAEFFELFKTPWELYRPGKQYEAVLVSNRCDLERIEARVLVVYGGQANGDDAGKQLRQLNDAGTAKVLDCPFGGKLPIYGCCMGFEDPAHSGMLFDAESGLPVCIVQEGSSRCTVRVGYDLFSEVRWLLTSGQPVANAEIPTLDLHIEVLRQLLVKCAVPFCEIPAAPKGYRFVVALTHDVDHPSIRLHKFDHTIGGFLIRAVFGSVKKLAGGRLGFGKVIRNWIAALKLPLVYLGWAQDEWLRFVEYTRFEPGGRSTFFFIPFRGKPGRYRTGSAPSSRAAAYGAADVAAQISTLQRQGCEIGLHGIDAWCDEEAARTEFAAMDIPQEHGERGVRMHWLYFDETSHEVLDRAGATYDSTIGYNGTVGYRAGTAQVYRPLSAVQMLELPLIVMDTALFYPSHLNLTYDQAWQKVLPLIENAAQFGGCVTINWHDRSLFPERLWADFYQEFVKELEKRGAWITTAAGAVGWFRERRSASFQADSNGAVRIQSASGESRDGHRLQLVGAAIEDHPVLKESYGSNT